MPEFVAGRAKSGKTLKQLKRYYAMKDATNRGHKGRSPEGSPRSPDGAQRSPEGSSKRSPGGSRRLQEGSKRSPTDDGLANRIAEELMRGKRSPETVSRPQIYIQPDRTRSGPIFVTQPIATPNVGLSGCPPTEKFVIDEVAPTNTVQDPVRNSERPSSRAVGITLACFAIAIIYISTWIFLYILEVGFTKKKNNASLYPEDLGILTLNIHWLAANSIPIIIVLPFWWSSSRTHWLVLTIVIASTLSVFASIIYRLIVGVSLSRKPLKHDEIYEDDSINYWLPTIYLILHLLTIFLMAASFFESLMRQIVEKFKRDAIQDHQMQSQNPMSLFLSPKSG